jgi:hypothetical protein
LPPGSKAPGAPGPGATDDGNHVDHLDDDAHASYNAFCLRHPVGPDLTREKFVDETNVAGVLRNQALKDC